MKTLFPQTYIRFLGPPSLCTVVKEGEQVEDATRFALIAYDQSCLVEFNVTEGWSHDARAYVAKEIGMERMLSALATFLTQTGRMP